MSRSRPGAVRSSGVVVPQKPRLAQRSAAGLVFVLERMLISTLRLRWSDRSGRFEGGELEPVQPVIFCIWHNRLALSMVIYRAYVRRRQPQRRLAALVSASKDGALLAAVLERFGVQPVRGSTSRRGPQALLEMTSWADKGYDLAITPDGPRGPRYVVQEGVLALAQVTGLPIVPTTFRASRKYRFKSWDQFQLPLPGAQCDIVFGEALRIPRDCGESEREEVRCRLEAWLREESRD